MSKSELLPSLTAIRWAGRDMAIAFDSDIVEKPRVQAAELRLADELAARGGIVRRVRLPQGSGRTKVGVDDYLLSHSIDDFIEIVSNTPATQGSYDPPVALNMLMANRYPPTEFVWADYVLKGEVNLLFGDGGIGKSLFALHLAVAVAAGKSLFGNDTAQSPVLALFAEDGEAQVQQRLQTILENLGLDASGDLPIRLWCQPRDDTLLASIDDNGVVKELPRLHALRAELAKIAKPCLVILDSLADLFAFDETLRLPVNAALKRVLGGLCRDFRATVLVLAHPSKASMQDGSYYSGSTAFNNGVRQRLAMKIIKPEVGDFSDGPPPRNLCVAKSNYGPPAEKILWFYGATIQDQPRGPVISYEAEQRAVLNTILGLIDKGVRIVNRNGGVGDARNFSSVAKTVRDQHGLLLSPARVKDHLRRFVDEGILRYREANKSVRPHIKAGFVRGSKCTT